MTNKIIVNGTVYIEAVPKEQKKITLPSPEDLIKSMNDEPVSLGFIKGILRHVSMELNQYGAEFVGASGFSEDNYISIADEAGELIIAPHIKNRETNILVEWLNYDGMLKQLGEIKVDRTSTYKEVTQGIKKAVSRAASYMKQKLPEDLGKNAD